jgi:hypothetical protein
LLPGDGDTENGVFYNDKKEKEIFLIYKEIQMGSIAKLYCI